MSGYANTRTRYKLKTVFHPPFAPGLFFRFAKFIERGEILAQTEGILRNAVSKFIL